MLRLFFGWFRDVSGLKAISYEADSDAVGSDAPSGSS